jgi:hypothetical protein
MSKKSANVMGAFGGVSILDKISTALCTVHDDEPFVRRWFRQAGSISRTGRARGNRSRGPNDDVKRGDAAAIMSARCHEV